MPYEQSLASFTIQAHKYSSRFINNAGKIQIPTNAKYIIDEKPVKHKKQKKQNIEFGKWKYFQSFILCHFCLANLSCQSPLKSKALLVWMAYVKFI